MEVHNAGGGINFTVNHTREASEERLLQLLEERLQQMLRSGKNQVTITNVQLKPFQFYKISNNPNAKDSK